ncbi:MAG TPA: pentapeptide repeat-containing protein, partial [Blastocatellia bacterium]|nr:pentapeptide repeat-containing protein [Blastocatellia bacterium]
ASLYGAGLDRASLVGASLYGAGLDRASLVGASLVGASLDRARLDGASLYGARYLTLDQIKSAWIDEDTTLPEELEKMKPQLLEWQRKGQEDLEREDDGEEFEFEEAEDDQ